MPAIMNHQWRLVSRPVGLIKESDFEWTVEPIPDLKEGELLARTIYLSLDPANRGWVNKHGTYGKPVPLNNVMDGLTISMVEQSKHPRFQVGDIVQGAFGWQEYGISNGIGLYKLPIHPHIPLTAYMGVLGMVGLTAYFGLLDIGKPQAGETLVISAGAGAVGSLVGQIGKIKGCRVAGIAGTDEKCRWITEELGFDAGINYKTEDIQAKLKEYCPNGIDIYFDNVGGDILDIVLSLINQHARIPLCGLISMYNATRPVPGPYNFSNILTKRVLVKGFIVTDFYKRYDEALAQLGTWYSAGKLQYRVDIVDGLERAPIAINKLFVGTNQGKLIIKISDEPSHTN